MVKPEWGTRYTCYKCGTRFYDLNKPEPICPKCEANQNKKPAAKAPGTSARARARVTLPEPVPDDIPDDDETEPLDDTDFETLADTTDEEAGD